MIFRLLFHNLGWKLLALALAVVLWAVFIGSPELVTSVSAQIEYQNVPPDLEMSSDAPARVHLDVEGPSARLRSVDPSQTAIILNLSAVQRPGEYTFAVERSHIDLPNDVKLLRAVPGQVRLRFERRGTAEVPVRVRFSAPPPEGYRIGRQQVRPQTLQIIGPESRIRQIGYVETDPLDLSRVVGSAQFRVHTFMPDPQVRFLSSSLVEVTISLEKNAPGGAPSDGGATAIRN
jgi:YbbR domain-containing protein